MRVVAVTGGAQGIGRAIALAFAGAGYAVSIADPAKDAGTEAMELIRSGGGSGLYEPADTSDSAAVEQWWTAPRAKSANPTFSSTTQD